MKKLILAAIVAIMATTAAADPKLVYCRKMGDLGSGPVYTFENFCPMGYYQIG